MHLLMPAMQQTLFCVGTVQNFVCGQDHALCALRISHAGGILAACSVQGLLCLNMFPVLLMCWGLPPQREEIRSCERCDRQWRWSCALNKLVAFLMRDHLPRFGFEDK